MARNVLTVEGPKAYYVMGYFGVNREVRAVDDITMTVRANEVYGIAGESSSGTTSFIKVLAAAMRPPLRLVAGSATYDFGDMRVDVTRATPAEVEAIRWRHLSYIMQGSMSVLNPVRKVGRTFEGFSARPLGLSGAALRDRVVAHLARLQLGPEVLNAYPHELSGGMRQRVTIGLATVRHPEFIIADEPTSRRPRSTCWCKRRCCSSETSSSRWAPRWCSSPTTCRFTPTWPTGSASSTPAGWWRRRPRGRCSPPPSTPTPRTSWRASRASATPPRGRRWTAGPPNLSDPPQGCRFHPRCPLAVDRCRREAPPLEAVGEDHRSACGRRRDVVPLPGSIPAAERRMAVA